MPLDEALKFYTRHVIPRHSGSLTSQLVEGNNRTTCIETTSLQMSDTYCISIAWYLVLDGCFVLGFIINIITKPTLK
jgi:hypothetical protein